jgi:hypothetical protein
MVEDLLGQIRGRFPPLLSWTMFFALPVGRRLSLIVFFTAVLLKFLTTVL